MDLCQTTHGKVLFLYICASSMWLAFAIDAFRCFESARACRTTPFHCVATYSARLDHLLHAKNRLPLSRQTYPNGRLWTAVLLLLLLLLFSMFQVVFAEYTIDVMSLANKYGVTDEGQLVSGQVCSSFASAFVLLCPLWT